MADLGAGTVLATVAAALTAGALGFLGAGTCGASAVCREHTL